MEIKDLSYYFDLASFTHRSLFDDSQQVFDFLHRLEQYIKANLEPEILGTVMTGAFVGDNVYLGAGSVVQPGAWIHGPAIIGKNCQIRHGAYVGANTLTGDNVIIGHDTEVGNSVFLNGAKAPHFAFVGHSILGNNVNLGAGTKLSNLKVMMNEIEVAGIKTGLNKIGAIIGDNSSPGFNLAALAAVIYLIQRIFIYIQQLQRNLHSINELIPHLKSVLDYYNQAAVNPELDLGQDLFSFTNQLELHQVGFSYRQDKKIFNAIDLSVSKGELVGIIGPSGVGKTTLVDLLLRLFLPTNGKILLDGKDISNISLASWRKNVGYVSQDIFLTNDTIANNIRFYNPAITDDQIRHAAKMANIYDFIQTLPEGFDFKIGDRGLFLSVGQRQRIAIARVLAREPQLLILDEATSALDNESELAIQQVLNQLRGQITILVIAHRLSTVMGADRLVVLGDGKVQEVGSPAELLKQKDSYFFKVYNLNDQTVN